MKSKSFCIRNVLWIFAIVLSSCGPFRPPEFNNSTEDKGGGQTTNGGFAFSHTSIPLLNWAQMFVLRELERVHSHNVNNILVGLHRVDIKKLESDIRSMLKTKFSGKNEVGQNDQGNIEPKLFSIEKGTKGELRIVAQPLYFSTYAAVDPNDPKARYEVTRAIVHEALHLQGDSPGYSQELARGISSQLLEMMGADESCIRLLSESVRCLSEFEKREVSDLDREFWAFDEGELLLSKRIGNSNNELIVRSSDNGGQQAILKFAGGELTANVECVTEGSVWSNCQGIAKVSPNIDGIQLMGGVQVNILIRFFRERVSVQLTENEVPLLNLFLVGRYMSGQ
ncbi:MAG: hypothetical protein KDD25_04720 [Bdellovibrionales bacterium]|nr:hypothetical protein [Bdellovibrionales bacterium]